MAAPNVNWGNVSQVTANQSLQTLVDTKKIEIKKDQKSKHKTDWFGLIAAVIVIAVVVLIFKLT
ncbi:MAG: hypothetical protein E7430_07245 [Ruminococcaceae bacterium]|nr:hypothetical protein [Oscillospiraceae bacterium]